MTRILKKDYEELVEFIDSYSLSNVTSSSEHINQLKSMHKKLFSLSNLVYSLQNGDKLNALLSERSYDYLNECISDLCSTLFMWLNGAYKPSKLVLRSCIETFIKSVLGNEDEAFLKLKNVYEVFEIASKIEFFTNHNNKVYFEKLNNQYSELCITVHSGDIKYNAQLCTLERFPSYDESLSLEVAKRFVLIAETITFLIISNFDDAFHKMHHTIKDSTLDGLPAKLKKDIFKRYL